MFSLVVKQVSWNPAYDLHISMTGNTPSPTVTLDFRCTVSQWTGENWENISLSLTTANQVSQLIQVPEPKKINISLGPTSFFPPAYAPRLGLFGQPASQGAFNAPATSLRQRDEGVERDRDRERPAPPQQEFFGQQPHFGSAAPIPPIPVVDEAPQRDAPSQSVSQLISRVCVVFHAIFFETSLICVLNIQDSKDPITHIANGSIFIPSDHAAHHVLVASLSLQAEFMRVVVPSIDNHVYYTVRVTLHFLNSSSSKNPV